MRKNKKEKLKKIFSTVFKINEDKIDDKSSPSTVKGWDSLKQMNLVIAIEEEFDVEFDEDQIIAMQNFESIYNILKDAN